MNDLEFYDLDSITDYFELNTDNNPQHHRKLSDFQNEEDLPIESLEYKKSRKRRQNRESAARARARKKMSIAQVSDEIKILTDLGDLLSIENVKLEAENEMLKKELEFYKSMINQ